MLLVSGRLRADLVGLATGVALALLGVIPPTQALAGLSNPAVVVLVAVFVLTKGLEVTGLTDRLGARLARLAGRSEARFLAVVMLAAAFLSLFMNTMAAAAVLIPPVVALARRERAFSLRRALMPLAFGTLLGGTATLLTTANLVTSATLEAHGYAPYGLLDFLPVGLPVTLAGLGFMLLAGRRLLPAAEPVSDAPTPADVLRELKRVYHLSSGLHEVQVQADSPLVGRPARRPRMARDVGLTPLGIVDEGDIVLMDRLPVERRVQAGDVWLAVGEVTAETLARFGLTALRTTEVEPLLQEEAMLAEISPNPRGAAVGRTPQHLSLRSEYGVRVLMIWRNGHVVARHVHAEPLAPGDALLVYGPQEGIRRLTAGEEFVLLTQVALRRASRPGKAVLAGLALAVMLLPAALGWLPLALSALLGMLVVLMGGVLTPERAYQAVSWRVIFLIAGMIPLAQAMQQTGAAAYLSGRLLAWLGPGAPAWAVAAVFLLITVALAQVVSGQAAALILAPLAIAAAERYHLDPRGLAMAVAVPASLGFLLPTAHPVNLLVMGPAAYRPRDYLRVGLPLTLLLIPVILGTLALFWL